VVIDNIYVEGKRLSRKKVRVLDETFVHNGDYNALKYMPLYKDHIIVLLEDVPYDTSMDIVADIHVTTGNVTTSSTPVTYGTTDNANKVQYIDADKIVVENAALGLLEIHKQRIDYKVTDSISFGHSYQLVQWWHVAGADLYYSTSAGIYKKGIVDGQLSVLYTGSNFSVLSYCRLSGEIVFLDNDNNKIRSLAHDGLDFSGTVFKVFSGDTYVDVVDVAGDVFRYWPSARFGRKFLTGIIPVEIIATGTRYVIFTGSTVKVFTKSQMLLEGDLPLNHVAVSSVDDHFYAGDNIVYATVDGKVALTNLATLSVELVPGIGGLRNQFSNSSTVYGIKADGTYVTYNIQSESVVSQDVTVKSILDYTGYAGDTSSLSSKYVEGYVYRGYSILIKEVERLYGIPVSYSSQGTPVVVSENNAYDIALTKNDVSNAGLLLNYNRNNGDVEHADTIEYQLTQDSSEINTSFFMSYSQAYLTTANYYMKNILKNTRLTFTTNDISLCPSGFIAYKDNVYVVTRYVFQDVIHVTCEQVPDTEITAYPSEQILPPVDTFIAFDSSDIKTKIMYIPVSIDDNERFTYCYIGLKPGSVKVREDTIELRKRALESCDTTKEVPTLLGTNTLTEQYSDKIRDRKIRNIKGASSIGELRDSIGSDKYGVDTPAASMVEFGKLIDADTLQVRFVIDMRGRLLPKTYDALIADKLANLVFVGREAVQFEDVTFSPDGKTVTFINMLRGRFNTSFFTPFHQENEDVFVYSPTTVKTFYGSTETVVAYIDNDNFEVFDGWTNKYTSSTEITNVEVDKENKLVNVTLGPSNAFPIDVFLTNDYYAFNKELTPFTVKQRVFAPITVRLPYTENRGLLPVLVYAYGSTAYPFYQTLNIIHRNVLTTGQMYVILNP
jgi:hypothetical protein